MKGSEKIGIGYKLKGVDGLVVLVRVAPIAGGKVDCAPMTGQKGSGESGWFPPFYSLS